ncbi:mitochondrial metalloendopeptidase oma1 [Phtheirospermum japonicum]|uniref:Mitochondrial metalloendopeptidase oma1 n=1 Tax=Phtheirospermum japonicum TaxID=374723 RepID=A0A830BF11_9LAMI|nr:mitochondrial metalloendopeptidase oma1 [Phtheirospermum japonicum]
MGLSFASLINVLALCLVQIAVYSWHLETVPYTNRKHFVLLSSAQEKNWGEIWFQQTKELYNGKILPPLHPQNIRVQEISRSIIEAVKKGLRTERAWIANRKDAIPDDERVLLLRSRKSGKKRGVNSERAHLEGLEWEVIVVDESLLNAWCSLGGKILISTGFLMFLGSDAEVATIVGHEVAHAVARHVAEAITEYKFRTGFQLLLYKFFMPDDIANKMTNGPDFFPKLPFSQSMEIEADYIGLLLAASAGYDPRAAPQVYVRLVALGDSPKWDYHPPAKKRAQLLSQANVMDEALSLYRKAYADRYSIFFSWFHSQFSPLTTPVNNSSCYSFS